MTTSTWPPVATLPTRHVAEWTGPGPSVSRSPSVGRVVIDRTGLDGLFDYDLTWTLDTPTTPSATAGSGAPASPGLDGSSLFRALEEQLGLKLQPMTAPLDVVVIERAELPTDN
ncbi:MAG: TIGR03435 family protein [Vicinamibacterales bacterium]